MWQVSLEEVILGSIYELKEIDVMCLLRLYCYTVSMWGITTHLLCSRSE